MTQKSISQKITKWKEFFHLNKICDPQESSITLKTKIWISIFQSVGLLSFSVFFLGEESVGLNEIRDLYDSSTKL